MASLTFQDVVVTVAAGAALVVLLRPFLPRWLGGARPAPDGSPCASCAAGAAAKQATTRRT